MSFLLSIETSTSVCSAALHKDGEVIAHRELHEDQAHASKLAILIDELFKFSQSSIRELNAVSVSSGPGSYTGLRIGTSTAKGICYSNSVPLVAVNSLEVMCERVRALVPDNVLLCPMLDARRMEVYTALYDRNRKLVMPIQSRIMEEGAFQEWLKEKPVVFFGNGFVKCKPMLTDPNALFIDDIYPEAVSLGKIASEKLLAGQVEDLISFEPFYLKEFLIKTAVKP